MQLQIVALNGEVVSTSETPTLAEGQEQGYIDLCIDAADNCHAIIGEALDRTYDQRVFRVIAAQGLLVCQNVLDPEV